MRPFDIRLILAIVLFALPLPGHAHIGSPTVFHEGQAGAFPVRVIIRPPGVIPGLAEISVRVNANGPHRVTVLPLHWRSAKNGAPTPDEAALVRGETNLYSAQLWFMVPGAQSVEINVTGGSGQGSVIVPVNAIATNVLTMPRQLGIILTILGALLVILAAAIAGAAVRESVLPAGAAVSDKGRWYARAGTAVALAAITGFLWLGKLWWESEANDYRNNRLYRPADTDANLTMEGDQAVLRIKYSIELMRRNGPLVPDHGKLMHLFLMREPDLTFFAHLHPRKVDWQTFETGLPELPAGDYTLYGDVTYETGLADTLTTRFSVPAAGVTKTGTDLDADDSWSKQGPIGTADDNNRVQDENSHTITRLSSEPFIANQEARLQFTVTDASGKVATPGNYMGMRGHLVVRHQDGSVFTHLHPSGSYSMAAQQLFEMRIAGKAPLKIAAYTNDPLCRLPLVSAPASETEDNKLTFPYEFPKAGRYRVWVQTRVSEKVITGVFDLDVQAAKPGRAGVLASRNQAPVAGLGGQGPKRSSSSL